MSFWKRLFGQSENVPDVKERTVRTLQTGDFVTYDLMDYEVVGKLVYNDSGYTWTAYQLKGETGTRWLSVEQDDDLEIGMYETVRLPGAEPGSRKLSFEGRTYYLEEQGEAYVKGEGTGSNVHGKPVRYFDYEDDSGDHFLSVEVWGGDVEVSSGFEVEEYEITILAGS